MDLDRSPIGDLSDRHPSIQHFAQMFNWEHLPEGRLRAVSIECCALAEYAIEFIPDGQELAAGLRKLLEAKDCFVRAQAYGVAR